ncbi:uncharacterized protein [Euwallacea fornicatus]|uniref:uncharacterized protein n=1 Tax=Euwallacea fornicatus TaxID=995702 RepID=UPI00338D6E07
MLKFCAILGLITCVVTYDLMEGADGVNDLKESEVSSYLRRIEDLDSIPIYGNYVVLEKTAFRGSKKMNADFVERCASFLAERELRIKFPESEARALLTGARSKKIKRVILPLLLLLKLKAAIVLPIVLSVIALVSFKGFGMSLAALAVAGTTALKNIIEHAGSKVSYEVVPAPIGHWGRSGVVVDNPEAGNY